MHSDQSSAPKYIRLANELEKQIKDGFFKADEKLLSENELCKMYNISRITVRQALKLLETKNLIYTFHGKGTFVKVPAMATHTPEIVSLSKKLSSKGLLGHTEIDSFETGINNIQAANFLGIPDTTPLSKLRLTAIIENLPAASYESYFEESLGKKIYEHAKKLTLEKKAFTPYDIYRLLNIKLDHANQTISAADKSIAPSLTVELPDDKALLVLTSIFYAKSQKALEYRMAIYRSDFYSFDITRNI